MRKFRHGDKVILVNKLPRQRRGWTRRVNPFLGKTVIIDSRFWHNYLQINCYNLQLGDTIPEDEGFFITEDIIRKRCRNKLYKYLL